MIRVLPRPFIGATACCVLAASLGCQAPAARPAPIPPATSGASTSGASTQRAKEVCPPPTSAQGAIAFETEAGRGDLVPLCRDAYVESATTAAERESLRAAFSEAARSIADALGPRQTDTPLTLFCKTDPCRRYFAGPSFRSRAIEPGARAPGARYVASDRPTILVLETGRRARGIAAHEMVHVELAARLHDAVAPNWFQEGLAAFVSGAPDCSDHPPKGVDDLRRLDSPAAWDAYTNVAAQQHPTYCQARAEVAAWIAARGDASLAPLLASLGKGAPFYATYGRLQDCETGCSGPLGVASPTRLRFYPLDEKRDTRAFDVSSPNDPSRAALLSGTARWVPGHRGSALKLSGGGFLRTEAIEGLGVVDQPFSLDLWMKPSVDAGVVVHASVKPSGGDGWCAPLLGFDASGNLVGQVLYALHEKAFLVARGPKLPTGAWSRVTMTWGAAHGVRLFVNGALAGTGAPSNATQEHHAAPGGRPVHLTYGSDQGSVCWAGAIQRGAFDGALDDLGVFNFEQDPS